MKYQLASLILAAYYPRVGNSVVETGISTVLCHHHVLMYVFGLRSLFFYSKMEFPLYVIDDGSLTTKDIRFIQKHLPVRVERNSRQKTKRILGNYKWLNDYRFDSKSMVHKLKLDLLLISPFARQLILDADILFMSKPDQLLNWLISGSEKALMVKYSRKQKINLIENENLTMFSFRKLMGSYLNADIEAYTSTHLLGIPDRQKIDLEKANDLVRLLYRLDYAYKKFAEEVIMTYICSFFKKDYLSLKYYFNLLPFWMENFSTRNNQVKMIHFPGQAKKFYWRILLKKLISPSRIF